MDDVHLADATAAAWAARCPDLDTATLRTFLLLARVSAHALRRVEANFEAHGLTLGEFDLLASLLHAPDHQLKPTQLAGLGMVSPAGMTNRIDRLERAGCVERRPDPADRRSALVTLTPAGRELAETAVVGHVAVEADVLSPLGAAERRQLDRLLAKLLRHQSRVADPSGDR